VMAMPNGMSFVSANMYRQVASNVASTAAQLTNGNAQLTTTAIPPQQPNSMTPVMVSAAPYHGHVLPFARPSPVHYTSIPLPSAHLPVSVPLPVSMPAPGLARG
jgi:hypothetical protein